jgi:asparagine N-glycosylation enzyme membrane subunit Stt3
VTSPRKASRREARDAKRHAPAGVVEPPSSAFAYRLHLAGASFLLVLLAWHRFATVTSEPGGRFEDPDAVFHAHRAASAIASHALLPPVFDRFENFPAGGRAMWPPLHDASLALLARLGGSTAADPRAGLTVAAAFPVLELVLALFAGAALARRTGGNAGGTLTAWLFATTACLPRRGAFGEIDHNITEVLGALLLTLLATWIADRKDGLAASLSPVLWAAAVLVALGFYAGLVLAAGFAAVGAAAAGLCRDDRHMLPRLSLGFGLAALVLPFFAGLRMTPEPGDPWRLGPVYVLILGAAAAGTGGVALLAALQRGFATGAGLVVRGQIPAFSGIALGVVAAALTPPAARVGFATGLGFLGSRDPWLSTIEEFTPLFTNTAASLAALPAVPAGLLALAFVAARARRLARETWVALLPVALPFLLYTALALVEKRLLPPAAAFGAAAAGAAWGLLRAWGAARWSVLAASGAGALIAAASFLFGYLGDTFRGTPAPAPSAAEEAAGAFRALTPPPGDPPAWGVLAPWDYGHEILWRSDRAVALNNFGNFHPGFDRATRIWLDASPAHAVSELDALKLRYVLAVYPPNVLPGAAISLREDASRLFAGGYRSDRLAPYEPSPPGLATLLVRLHLGDGRRRAEDTDADARALARLKKLWESPETGPGPGGRPVPFMKLFEVLSPAGPK